MNTIAERIEHIRNERKISQAAMGDALGVTQQAYAKTKHWNDSQFTIGQLRTIAKTLDVPVSHLIFPREELDIMREPDPVIAPIIAEVSRIASLPDREKSDTYLAVLLASAKAMK